MKKFTAIILTAIMALSFAACGNTAPAAPEAPSAEQPAAPAASQPAETEPAAPAADSGDGIELALITDLGTIDDKSFNQGAWEGLEKYAKEKSIQHKYYQPPEQSDDAYLATIDLAVKGGAKVIVTPGFLFEVPIFLAQDRYPDVKFILLDGDPHSADYSEFKTNDNAVAVHYAEEQSGFLAGYAAVKDGNTKLGFMGGMAVPAVVRFGLGYVQGADFAAKELGLPAGSITVNYHYTGAFEASPEAQAMAASWYNDGVEVIFGCGGAVGNSVMAAAEQAGKKVIGVDVDQSGESATVITSAMKDLSTSVYDVITQHYAGSFPGGQSLIFGADNNGVGLPMDASKFDSFSKADYDAIFAKLVDGSVNVQTDSDVDANDPAPTKLTLECTSVTVIG